MNDDFDDSDLAAGVRRCWGDDRAPADLRYRVATRLAAGRAAARFGQHLRRASAAAAVLAVAGLAGVMAGHRSAGPADMASTTVSTTVLPASLEAELVQTHDQCARGADHQGLPVPQANGYAIAASLRSRLDRPVLVSRPADAGWRFAGASVCPVGRVDSAHLVFRRRDGDTLSIFSLPRSSAPAAADGQQFQAVVRSGSVGHPIVGFVNHGAVYCLVGSGCAADVSVARLADIRRQLQQQVVVADAPTPPVPADGQLIYGTGR